MPPLVVPEPTWSLNHFRLYQFQWLTVYLRTESRGSDAAQHSPEHHFVDGAQKIPVHDPEQTARLEFGQLRKHGRSTLGLCAELQPGAPGNLHLGEKPQPPAGFVRFYAPEIQGASRKRSLGIGPASSHAYTAHHQIDPAAKPDQ